MKQKNPRTDRGSAIRPPLLLRPEGWRQARLCQPLKVVDTLKRQRQ
jgi:hypothetical protein